MPFVNLKVAGDLSPDQVRILQHGLTDLMAEVMHKKRELTATLVEQAGHGEWSIGGAGVVSAAYLEVKITAGTNDLSEKAQFVDRAYALLRKVIGPLPTATYVVVHEIAADAWGYSGLTQAERASRARAA